MLNFADTILHLSFMSPDSVSLPQDRSTSANKLVLSSVSGVYFVIVCADLFSWSAIDSAYYGVCVTENGRVVAADRRSVSSN